MNRRGRAPRRLAASGVLAVAMIACAAEEPRPRADPETAPISGGVIVDTAPSTAPLAGSPAELLAEMAAEMSRLGALVAEGGDARGALDHIETVWAAVEPDVEATRPGLVTGIAATLELAESSVTRRRPADADKAFRLLTDLVDSYTGDG